jgi:hypothetical protein
MFMRDEFLGSSSTPEASPALAAGGSSLIVSLTAPQGAGLTCGVEVCQWCAGHGQVRGEYRVAATCPDCGGRGSVCSWCAGLLVTGGPCNGQCTRCLSALEERRSSLEGV